MEMYWEWCRRTARDQGSTGRRYTLTELATQEGSL